MLALPDQIVHEAEKTRSGETGETTPTDLDAVGNLFDEVLTGKVTIEEACMSQELTRIIERLDVKKQSIRASRTAKPWLLFMKMMDIIAHVPQRRKDVHLGIPHPSTV